MSLLADLRLRSPHLSPASRFTTASGVMYMAAGLLLLSWPDAVQVLFRDPAFAGHEGTLTRIIGMTVAIIGWFYYVGGRTGGRAFVAATVLDRLVLVPLVLVPAAISGVSPHLLLTFAVLDPLLALVAWRLLSSESR